MDDEDKIVLAGIGALGAVAYIAIKEIQERNELENSEKGPTKQKDTEELFPKIKVERETPIYKNIAKFIKDKTTK